MIPQAFLSAITDNGLKPKEKGNAGRVSRRRDRDRAVLPISAVVFRELMIMMSAISLELEKTSDQYECDNDRNYS